MQLKKLSYYLLPVLISTTMLNCKLKTEQNKNTNASIKTEVDNFTQRYNPLKDSLVELNKITQEYMQKALDTTNSSNDLSIENLYSTAYKTMGGGYCWGYIESEISSTDRMETCKISKSDSVYKQLTFYQAFAFLAASLGTNFKVGRYMIGNDKIGHFIEEGYLYYQKAYVENAGLSEALKIGEKEESTFWGVYTASIYSYGDLYANFKGGLMWYKFAPTKYNNFGKFNSTTGDVSTYVILENGKWKLNPKHPYDWAEYIDAGFDEGINCSGYGSDSVWQEVKSEMLNLEKNNPGKRYLCPAEPDLCVELVTKMLDPTKGGFPEFATRLINKRCIAEAAKINPQFTEILRKYNPPYFQGNITVDEQGKVLVE